MIFGPHSRAALRYGASFSRRLKLDGRRPWTRLLKRLTWSVLPYLPRGEFRYVNTWGHQMMASLSDHMEILGFLGFQEHLPKGIAAVVLPGSTIIDAGANVGLFTSQLCRMVGSNGCVWAIEPLPRNVNRLYQLQEMNSLRQLRILNVALSSTNGSASIRLASESESGRASLTSSFNTGGAIEVPTWRLDDLVFHEPKLSSLSLLKLDVEGSEPQVLKGAERTLRELRPVVFCEFNDILLRDAGSSAEMLLQDFARLGYYPVSGLKAEAERMHGRIRDVVLVHA